MSDEADEMRDKDTLLLNSLMDLVPDSGLIQVVSEMIGQDQTDASRKVLAMLNGYGTLLNIIQAAVELDEEGTIYDRLSAAYYELTNRDPGADDDEIRLRDDD